MGWHHIFFVLNIYGLLSSSMLSSMELSQDDVNASFITMDYRVVMRLICVYVTSWGMTYIVHNGY